MTLQGLRRRGRFWKGLQVGGAAAARLAGKARRSGKAQRQQGAVARRARRGRSGLGSARLGASCGATGTRAAVLRRLGQERRRRTAGKPGRARTRLGRARSVAKSGLAAGLKGAAPTSGRGGQRAGVRKQHWAPARLGARFVGARAAAQAAAGRGRGAARSGAERARGSGRGEAEEVASRSGRPSRA